MQPTVFILDDDPAFTRALSQLACTEGYQVQVAHTLGEAHELLGRHRADLLILDLDLPDGSGLGLLEELDMSQHGQVAIVTGNPTLDTARRAVGSPVVEYLLKPVRVEQLESLLRRTMLRHWPEPPAEARSILDRLVGKSPAMREVMDTVFRIASSDAPVLLIGESGTGKERVARAVHEVSGRQGRFVALGCDSLPDEGLGHELFGSVSDPDARRDNHAGIFEQAAGGTVFLDRVTELPSYLQAQLLRFIDSGEVKRIGADDGVPADVRLVFSTTIDPAERIAEGGFREDLYYAISDFRLCLPPLRERGDDVVLLAGVFIRRLNEHYGQAKRLAPGAERELLEHDWPGNIRELRGAVQRAYLLQRGDQLRVQPQPLVRCVPRVSGGASLSFAVGDTLAELERRAVLATLEHFDNDKTAAAKALGVSVRTIYNHLARISGKDPVDPDPRKAA
ncbi:sigma-54 dependent transcriptional regulator [Luteimonas sp. MC1750]|uniref:sigma-54-dependent transcriptional regulator n=1 Tax=Luteimonas sp. MC1750 TaxID=2799326 RepID=UPI0018F06FA8|nr:sigma-54 dependent transcriptional regulator [Luteimonas sp. MC1750]MBJ6983732.1 sigma-54-dependent Fis family transcriptional regulator [Luteimonas sp. MC1750]QQO06567.1 sigma-54-dependent Fis family transcriptional regulator [Luteimonas sp. MC1750]